jgi:hypothetical protein
VLATYLYWTQNICKPGQRHSHTQWNRGLSTIQRHAVELTVRNTRERHYKRSQ